MRRILTTLWALLICLGAHAQITRNIWGLTLGQSTAAEVRKALRERGYGLSMRESAAYGLLSITVDNTPIQFGGGQWNSVSFHIQNGRLSSVLFDYESTVPQNAFATKMGDALNKKYSGYKSEYNHPRYRKMDVGTAYTWTIDIDYVTDFKDGKTEVFVLHESSTKFYNPSRVETTYSVTLCYSDSNLGGAGSESDL